MNLTKTDEPTNRWRNFIVMFGLFTAHFVIGHRLVSRRVGALGTDPCDAVNLFAFVTIALIAIVSLLRMFSGSSSPLRYLYVIRAQQAVLFAIFMMFMAEIIALARNPEMWTRVVSPTRIFALHGALAAVTVATLLLILVTQRNRISLSSLRLARRSYLSCPPSLSSLFVRNGQPTTPQGPRTSSPLLLGRWWSSSRCAFSYPNSC